MLQMFINEIGISDELIILCMYTKKMYTVKDKDYSKISIRSPALIK